MTNNEAIKKPKSESKIKEAERKKQLYESSQHQVRARISGPDGSWTGIISAALGPNGEPLLRVENEVPTDGFDPIGSVVAVDSHRDKVHSLSGEIEVLPKAGKKGKPMPASVIRPIRKVRPEQLTGPDGEPLVDDKGEPIIQEVPYAMLRVDPMPTEAPPTLT